MMLCIPEDFIVKNQYLKLKPFFAHKNATYVVECGSVLVSGEKLTEDPAT